MATEIERKFLVTGEGWRAGATDSKDYRQAYLANNRSCSVRVRIGAGAAHLNIKSATLGIERMEFEYPIALQDAEEMLASLSVSAVVEKTRYFVPHGSHLWEVDVFTGANRGLVIAEIELRRGGEDFTRPPWLGADVSHDPRYYNVYLAEHPYTTW